MHFSCKCLQGCDWLITTQPKKQTKRKREKKTTKGSIKGTNKLKPVDLIWYAVTCVESFLRFLLIEFLDWFSPCCVPGVGLFIKECKQSSVACLCSISETNPQRKEKRSLKKTQLSSKQGTLLRRSFYKRGQCGVCLQPCAGFPRCLPVCVASALSSTRATLHYACASAGSSLCVDALQCVSCVSLYGPDTLTWM